MAPVETNRTCYVCKKLFCCASCREQHEEKKHKKRQPNCPFCINEKFSFKSLEDKVLLCHIAVTHLPLYCYLCGEIFKQIKDLETFGTCKWWKSQHRYSLVSKEQRSVFGTPPLTSEEKASCEHFGSLTSPPELYRNTSTPMVIGQKTSLDFKTPSAPNFSLKTPKTNSALKSSLKSDNSSNYMSCPSATIYEETPFRSLPLNQENKEFSRGKSINLGIIKNKDNSNPSGRYMDNNCIEDMELTNVEDEVLPDSQALETHQEDKRSDSLKKVRFSDQYEIPSEAIPMGALNVTENEDYYETCNTLSEMKESLEKSQIKIYEDNAKNIQKEHRSPEKVNVENNQQLADSSRIVMMVVMESSSKMTTSDLIESSLKKLERIVSNTNLSTNSNSSPGCSSSVTSVDSYYTASSHNYYPSSNELSSPDSKDSSTSSNNTDDSNSGGILSAVANAVKNVMRNLTIGSYKNVEKEQVLSRDGVAPTPSTSEASSSLSNFTSSFLQRSGKRPRDDIENAPPPQTSTEFIVPQIELRSPVAKRHRGWYKIKGREPIARMRNNRQLTSQRGVSLETQVFHQGSLSVGNTVLPLPDRAHQSTQTE
ncbi:dentin sialophosphoprotein-like isoform X1 [Bombus pyrosoma]|uniref:dentin sialophosphoprotein-like isoform X1 n=1 Tax=Bombus pyrosoma TaxID=396416 RepID=UPI001CB991B7|nr:dentin sialophosphoprotein-like isoform X1 [Bombus pyrosoma]